MVVKYSSNFYCGEPRFNHPKVIAGIDLCSKAKGIDIQTLFDSLKTDVEDAKLRDYNYCIMKAIDLVKDDGKPNMEVAKEYTEQLFPEKKEIVLKTCFKYEDDPVETSYGIVKCLSKLNLLD